MPYGPGAALPRFHIFHFMKPLPSTLKEKDTVCQYCGVSYLIMHEIEKLKNEINELKKRNALLERKNAASQMDDRDQV